MRFASQPAFITSVLLLFAAGCGARTAAEDPEATETEPDELAFVTGTFTGCASGIVTTDPGHFRLGSGFQGDATLTLEQTGDTVIATWRDIAGLENVLEFAIVADHSARVAPDQVLTGHSGYCQADVGAHYASHFPAELLVSDGAISYESGTVHVALEGLIEGDSDECGHVSATAVLWITCDRGPAPETGERTAPSPAPRFPTGALDCTSHVATHYSDGETTHVGVKGGTGALEVAQSGAELSATYVDDALLESARLTAVTEASAIARDASVRALCDVPVAAAGPLHDIAVGAVVLTAGESSVVLSFVGTIDESTTCPGARKAGAIVCLSR